MNEVTLAAAKRSGNSPIANTPCAILGTVPNWDDVRYFLALAEAGSLAGAGRQLKVKHTTVARRVGQLEEDLGVALITRSAEGVTLTEAGERALVHAREAAAALEALALGVRGADDAVEGIVRVAVSRSFSTYLARRLSPLKERYPGLNVHVLAGDQAHDLSRGEADLAVRMRETQDLALLIRRVVTSGWSLYATRGYLEGKTPPRDVASLREHSIVGFNDELAGVPGALWLREQGLADQVVIRTNSIPSALDATLGGMGIAALPCLVAVDCADLVRVLDDVVCVRPLWLVAHPDVIRSARVRAVWDYLVALIERDRELISGARVPQ